MVRNIGGYSRSFGSNTEATDYVPRRAPQPQSEPDRPHRPRAGRYEIASPEKSVGALVGLALDGKELPLDVSRYLLADAEREEAVVQARRAIIRAQTHRDIDMSQIESVFDDLLSRVIKNVKR